jgi:hypothetical protein
LLKDPDDDEYCLTINSDIKYETVDTYTIDENRTQKGKKLFATFELEGKLIKFQLDCGATCNVIPGDLVPSKQNLEVTRKVLKMYKNTIVTPLGQCKLRLQNPSNEKSYDIEFVVVDGCSPILGSSSIQEMDLMRVQYHNIMGIKAENSENKSVVNQDNGTMISQEGPRNILMCFKGQEN